MVDSSVASPVAHEPALRNGQGTVTSRSKGGPALHFISVLPQSPPAAAVGIVHGYAEHAERYRHVMEWWAARGIGSVALDLRGHGRSQGRRGACLRFDDYLDDASELAGLVSRHAPGAPAFLFGHSFGGLVSASLVEQDPGSWRGLLLSSPYFGLALAVPGLKRWAGIAASSLMPGFSLPSGVHGADLTRDPARAHEHDADPLGFQFATARWFTESLAGQDRALAAASSLSLPLYLVMGTADRVARLSAAQSFFDAAGSKDKTLDVRQGFFHEVLNEPEWRSVADAMSAWLLARAAPA